MNKLLILILILFFISCNDAINNTNTENTIIVEPEQQSGDMYANKVYLNSLECKLSEGDTTAYNQYEMVAGLSGHDREFLFYSLRMAEEFNYPRAYYKTYFILSGTKRFKSERYDKLKMYYLLRAYELGFKDAVYDVDELFPNGNIPSSTQYDD